MNLDRSKKSVECRCICDMLYVFLAVLRGDISVILIFLAIYVMTYLLLLTIYVVIYILWLAVPCDMSVIME